MDYKIIILGGRSGTSTLANLFRVAGVRLWAEQNWTEPPGLPDLIRNNTENRAKVASHVRQYRKMWDVMKCPEAAFFLDEIDQICYPVRYIHLMRPIEERVQSHIHLGWHRIISRKMQETPSLQRHIRKITSQEVTKDDVHNNRLYFMALDLATTAFFQNGTPSRRLIVHYSELNDTFGNAMCRIAKFSGLDFKDNIDQWIAIKQRKHQAGRWNSQK